MSVDPTARYRFEFRIAEFSGALSRRLVGKRTGMFIGFRTDGSVRRLYLSPAGRGLSGKRKERLVEHYETWFLYSPFSDAPGTYIEWLGISSEVMCRWLEAPIEPADLADVRGAADLEVWPETWRVIVG